MIEVGRLVACGLLVVATVGCSAEHNATSSRAIHAMSGACQKAAATTDPGAGQDSLIAAGTEVIREAHALGNAGAGYSSQVLHGDRYLAVYWRGPVPLQLRRNVAAKVPCAAVEYRSAPFDEQQLTQAKNAVSSNPIWRNLDEVGATGTGSGLFVGVDKRLSPRNFRRTVRTVRQLSWPIPVFIHRALPAIPVVGHQAGRTRSRHVRAVSHPTSDPSR